MSIVFAGITPHPPALIPELTQDETPEDVKKTIEALKELEQDLYLSKPDILIVLSAYSGVFEETFVINVEPTFTANFETFGDFSLSETWLGATDFAAKIMHGSYTQEIPIKLMSQPTLDPGVTIPLHMLGDHLKHVKILPIGFSHLSVQQHVAFGQLLKEVCVSSNKRIAILVSGNLSSTLRDDSPAEYHPDGQLFDTNIRSYLTSCDCSELQHMSYGLVQNAQETIYKSLLILSGILHNTHFKFT